MASGYNTSVVSGRIFYQLTGALTTVISQGQAGELPVLYNSPYQNPLLSLPCVLSNTAHTLPCAVSIHKTCTDQQWMSMYWQRTKHFDLSQCNFILVTFCFYYQDRKFNNFSNVKNCISYFVCGSMQDEAL